MFEKIRGIIAEKLGIDEEEITMESAFIEDLNADSLDIVELIMALEDEFDMSVDDDALQTIKTVQDLVEYIEAHK